MEHITLYRKWRPQTFSEVIGQSRVTDTLANALSSRRLVHAYLFSGPRGTGKTSTARILAKAINCEHGPTATPCGVCEACVSISEGTALDVIEIDAASNRKIDEIRDLLDKIPYTPVSLRTKVYIIDEVHQLTTEASSALLKTLEEPPGHVVFVLATTEPHKLLGTIISRCQRFDFSLVGAQDLEGLLEHIASREGIKIDTDALGMIAEHAHGSVRDAIGVMDQISNLPGERITSVQLADMLGEVEVGLVFEMVDMITTRDTPGVLTVVGRLFEGGKDPRRFVEALISHLRGLFLVQNAANPSEIVEATAEHYARLEEQAAALRRHEVVRLIERLGEAHRQMRFNENPRLVLECALVKITSLDADATLEGLAFRIEELSRKIDAMSGGGLSLEAGAGRRPEAAREPSTGGAAAAKDRAGVAAEAGPTRAEKAAAEPDSPGEKSQPPEAAPAPSPGPPAPDREKARRAWMAVLAELKGSGMMKLYALLAKARVVSAGGGELVLGFGPDAGFQMEALSGSGDLAKVEDIWQKFMDQPVKIRLVTIQGPGQPPAEIQPSPGLPKKAVGKVEGKRGEKPAQAEAPPAEAEPAGEAGGEDSKPGGKSPAEIARMVKDRFNGEILEKGKD